MRRENRVRADARLIGMLAAALLAMMMCGTARAQVPQTMVYDTLINAVTGQPVAEGTIKITWPAFSYGATSIPANRLTYNIVNGIVSLSLTPTDHSATPASYSVSIVVGGITTSGYWQIPTGGGPYTILQVTKSAGSGTSLSILPSQITGAGALANQAMCFDGATWGPGNCGGAGVAYSAPFSTLAYSAGSIQVANGSTAVTGVGTNWDSTLTGRQLLVDSCGYSYGFTMLSPTTGQLDGPWLCNTALQSPASAQAIAPLPFPNVIATGTSDTLTVSVSGGTAVSLTLSAADTTAALLAADIQSQLTAAGVAATATANTATVTIATVASGASATLQLGGNAAWAFGSNSSPVFGGSDGVAYQLASPAVFPGSMHKLGTALVGLSCSYWSNLQVSPASIARIAVDATTFDVNVWLWAPGSGRCALQK